MEFVGMEPLVEPTVDVEVPGWGWIDLHNECAVASLSVDLDERTVVLRARVTDARHPRRGDVLRLQFEAVRGLSVEGGGPADGEAPLHPGDEALIEGLIVDPRVSATAVSLDLHLAFVTFHADRLRCAVDGPPTTAPRARHEGADRMPGSVAP